MLKGYRTIIVMGLGFVYSIAASFDIVLTTEEQANITGAVIALAAIVLRFMTDGKVGEK